MLQPSVEQKTTEKNIFPVKPVRVIFAKNHNIFQYPDIKHKE